MRKQAVFVRRLRECLETTIDISKREGKSPDFDTLIREAVDIYNARYPKLKVDTFTKHRNFAETAKEIMSQIREEEMRKEALLFGLFK